MSEMCVCVCVCGIQPWKEAECHSLATLPRRLPQTNRLMLPSSEHAPAERQPAIPSAPPPLRISYQYNLTTHQGHMLARGHRDRSPLRSRSIISQHLPTRSTMRPPPGHCRTHYVSTPRAQTNPMDECSGTPVCSHNSAGAKI